MRTYTQKELKEILDLHKKWLNNEAGGCRANLRSADLRYADLRFADLRSADLRYANLRSANLRYANLRYADLSSADLRSADLRSADLSSAIGEMSYVKSLQCEKYYISYTHTHMNIGCQSHTITEWQDFSNDTISKMDNGALGWWQKWKPIIMNIIEVSPALEQKN